MRSSKKLRRVALVRTNVSEERIATISRMTVLGEIGTTLAVISNRRKLHVNVVPTSQNLVILMMEAIRSSETSVHT
jgi:hypothetical protein